MKHEDSQPPPNPDASRVTQAQVDELGKRIRQLEDEVAATER